MQPPADPSRTVRLVADPTAIALDMGTSMLFRVVAFDADGNVVNPELRVSASLDALRVENSRVHALRPGEHAIIVSVVGGGDQGGEPPTLVIPVTVGFPPVTTVELDRAPGRLYAGTTLAHHIRAYHADGSPRLEPVVHWTSSDPRIASVDDAGNLTAHRPGQVTIAADVDGTRATVTYQVAAFAATGLQIVDVPAQARTGDVVALAARATDASGQILGDVPVHWAFTGPGEDDGTAASIERDRFVAAEPGTYTITASAGELSATQTLTIRARDLTGTAEPVGRGLVGDQNSSGFAVFHGRDGRDYAVTGTWIGDGRLRFWDVTDPANIQRAAEIQLAARGIRDIAVSPDARYAALTLEGAPDRRNGLVILDITDPTNPRIASTFGHGAAGDAHGVSVTDYHVFAIAADRGIVVLDVENIYAPQQVASFTFPDGDIRARDVHVIDGLAVVAALDHGILILDVGDGRWSGRPEDPTLVGAIPVGAGQASAAVPYQSGETGERYLFVVTHGEGDDDGAIQVLDWTDTASALPVASYRLPGLEPLSIRLEAGRLYAAYGDGGVRVVDVSGELLGDLRAQGREIASFTTDAPDVDVPESPMAWHAGPSGDHVLAVDRNSGLWAVRIHAPDP